MRKLCDVCHGWREQPHGHDDAPTLFDIVGAEHEKLMEPTKTTWDLEEGKRLRDEGMSLVTEHTIASYRRDFERIVRDFRSQRIDWTSEDVTARIGMPPGTHPNAVGAMTRAVAVRLGAEKIGRVKAQRSNQHATEIAQWGWR